MGENAATNDVIDALLDVERIVLYGENEVVKCIELVVSLNDEMQSLNSEVRFGRMLSDHLLNVYFDSRNENWLDFISYTALVQCVCIIGDSSKITIYNGNEINELLVPHSELMNGLLEVFKTQKKKLLEVILTVP